MAKDKGGRPGRTYRKAQSQRGNPMWRDPAHAQGSGGGCAVVAVALVGAIVAAGSAVVSIVA